MAGGGSAVDSDVQSLRGAECAWCRFCVCVRSAVFASGAQVFPIEFPSGVKLSQVVSECCPSGAKWSSFMSQCGHEMC